MKIEIKNIKKTIFFIAFLMFFSLGVYVFASVNEANEKNFLLDSDQDGLTDEEEKMYGTDPYKADTDGDGYSDGVEMKTGYDPQKPAPGDKIVEKEKTLFTDNGDNLTGKLSESLKPLLTATDAENSEEGKEISIEDIDKALAESVSADVSAEISMETLPDFVVPEDKFMRQNYASLTEEVRKERIKQDTSRYFETVAYIFANNLPEEVVSPEDLGPFVDSLVSHLEDLGQTPANYSFYVSLKSHVEMIVDEMSVVTVPENMLDVHKNMIRLLKSYLDLETKAPVSVNDPIAQVAFMNRVRTLNTLSAQYLQDAYYKVAEDMTGFKKE